MDEEALCHILCLPKDTTAEQGWGWREETVWSRNHTVTRAWICILAECSLAKLKLRLPNSRNTILKECLHAFLSDGKCRTHVTITLHMIGEDSYNSLAEMQKHTEHHLPGISPEQAHSKWTGHVEGTTCTSSFQCSCDLRNSWWIWVQYFIIIIIIKAALKIWYELSNENITFPCN